MPRAQQGVVLPATLLLLLAALALGASSAQMAWLGEKAARAERDRLIAFQAAEDALMDAQRGIEAGLTPASEPDAADAAAGWQAVDMGGVDGTEFGAHTGAAMATGQGSLPFRRPRYLVERLPRPLTGGATAYYYRVTAIGFGSRPGVEAVLQASFVPLDEAAPDGAQRRYGWREVSDWSALHAAAARRRP